MKMSGIVSRSLTFAPSCPGSGKVLDGMQRPDCYEAMAAGLIVRGNAGSSQVSHSATQSLKKSATQALRP